MYQSGYNGITNFLLNKLFVAGICKFWFIEKENIASFPSIDPATQFLTDEPAIVDGSNWYGPVIIPDAQLGFEEKMSVSAPGIFYQQKVSGFYPGDATLSRIQQENLPYYEFVIVAKMRAGKLYVILGDETKGLDYSADYSCGIGMDDTAGAKMTFTINALKKALILPVFLGNNVLPSNDVVTSLSPILTEDGASILTEDNIQIINE